MSHLSKNARKKAQRELRDLHVRFQKARRDTLRLETEEWVCEAARIVEAGE